MEPKLSDLALKLEAIEKKIGSDQKHIEELTGQLHRLHDDTGELCKAIHQMSDAPSNVAIDALVGRARAIEARWFPGRGMTFQGAPLIWDSEREGAERRRLQSLVNAIALACMRAQGCHDEIRLTATLGRIYGLCAGDPIEHRPESPAEQADPGFQGDHDTGV